MPQIRINIELFDYPELIECFKFEWVSKRKKDKWGNVDYGFVLSATTPHADGNIRVVVPIFDFVVEGSLIDSDIFENYFQYGEHFTDFEELKPEVKEVVRKYDGEYEDYLKWYVTTEEFAGAVKKILRYSDTVKLEIEFQAKA